MNFVLRAYYSLLAKYGKQNWWPAEKPYEVAVGAVLTQNANWRNVEKAIKNLKKFGLLKEEKILNIEIDRLKDLIKPAGFYNQKAIRLKEMTKTYVTLNKNEDVMSMREKLLRVKGIGKETADSIILYAFNKPIFVVDTYTKRFCLSEWNISFKEYDDYRMFFEKSLPKDVEIYKEYHALIVAWGKEKREKNLKID